MIYCLTELIKELVLLPQNGFKGDNVWKQHRPAKLAQDEESIECVIEERDDKYQLEPQNQPQYRDYSLFH